jgi:hypothetical protein
MPGQPPTWEHATWLRASDLTDGMLTDVVRPERVADDPTWSAEQHVRAVVAAGCDNVALVTRPGASTASSTARHCSKRPVVTCAPDERGSSQSE